jgi:predicted nucleotidyltransferase
MAVDESLLSQIVDRVLSVTRPDRIILFGSAATGKMSRDSDIDLLIIGGPLGSSKHDESLRIRDAIGDVRLPVDVILIEKHRFEATKDLIGGVAWPAHRYGRVLYDAAT